MKMRFSKILFLIITLFLLTGCGLLPNNQQRNQEDTPATQVAAEGEQQVTVTPIPDTPVPTDTPLPTVMTIATSTVAPAQSPTPDPDCEYGVAFVADVTIPDGMAVPAGVNFEKTWRVINTGTCTWEKGSTWVFADGAQMGADGTVAVPTAEPGEVVDISVWFISPTMPGTYRSDWHLKLWHGLELDTLFFVEIVVPLVTPTRIKPTASSGGTGGSGTATVAATPTSAPSATWSGQYYNNISLSGSPVFARNDANLDFDWGTGSPAAQLPADNFSAVWTRRVEFIKDTYRFNAFSDDGMRVYIDGVLILDEWHDADGFAHAIDVSILNAGSYEIRVEYYERSGDASIELSWGRVGAITNWRGEYFNNNTLTGSPVLTRDDTAVNFNWGGDAPASQVPANNFSVRWTRTVTFAAGNYIFRATIDDGMRVFIDDTLVLDEWAPNSSRTVSFTINLTAGQHALKVEYYDLTGDAIAILTWD
jgi:hypothetical protein